MDYNDFLAIYDDLIIGYFYDNYVNNYIESLGNAVYETRSFTITIPAAGRYYIGAEFYSNRIYASRSCDNYVNGYLRFKSISGVSIQNMNIKSSDYFNFMKFDTLAPG